MIGRFQEKVAVVTGGGSGIGGAIVDRLLSEGAFVVFGDIDTERGRAKEAGLPSDRSRFVHCDSAEQSSIDGLVAATVQAFGHIDILCNNAGISLRGNTLETDVEQWRKVLSTDLDSVFFGCRAAIPHMQRRGGGAIVNTASIAGLGGYYRMAAYSAAKAAVVNYTRSLAIDHAKDGIRVNAICPGLTETGMTSRYRENASTYTQVLDSIPLRRSAQPSEVASVVAFLASDDAAYVTGAILPVDGGVTAAVRKGSWNWEL